MNAYNNSNDLSFRFSNWRSIELRVITTQETRERDGSGRDAPMKVEYTYIHTSDGRRLFDQISSSNDHSVRSTGYSDGARCYTVVYAADDVNDQKQIHISRSFMNETAIGYVQAPRPLQLHYVGLVPLQDAIRDAKPIGTGQVLGKNCDVFLFENVGGQGGSQSLVYHLDNETSVPLKVEAFRTPEDLEAETPSWSWEARSLDVVDGYHLPKSSTYESFVLLQKGSKVERVNDIRMTILVEEARFDETYPSSTFVPEFQPGVMVFDGIAKKAYQVPGGEEPEATTVAEPIRAELPGSWTSSLTIGSLVLGLALVATGVILWVRRSATGA